jgi:predicted ABC-type ATPase
MSDIDERAAKDAISYVKNNAKKLVAQFAGTQDSQERPVSIFMAGSPGAGKTEFSVRLLQKITNYQQYIVRIDPDEIRLALPQYKVGKAEIMQPAVLGKNKSFLLDGTCAQLTKTRSNIKRSIDKGRVVKVQYVFQPPEVAWSFTRDREVAEGRNIRREDFISQFIAARDNVGILKAEFGRAIEIDLIERNITTNSYDILFNIDKIDKYLKKKYSEDDLQSLL